MIALVITVFSTGVSFVLDLSAFVTFRRLDLWRRMQLDEDYRLLRESSGRRCMQMTSIRPFSIRLRSLRRTTVLRSIPRVRIVRAVYSTSRGSAHALSSVHRGRAVVQWPNRIDLYQVIALVSAML